MRLQGPTYLCVKCNSRIERQMSWLLGRTQRVHSSVHNWSHPLLFVSKADPTPPKQLSIEDRLSLLEAKLDALTAAVRPTPPAHTNKVAGAVQEIHPHPNVTQLHDGVWRLKRVRIARKAGKAEVGSLIYSTGAVDAHDAAARDRGLVARTADRGTGVRRLVKKYGLLRISKRSPVNDTTA